MGAILEFVILIAGRLANAITIVTGIQFIANEIYKLLFGSPTQPGFTQTANTIVSINGDIENPSYGLAALATLIAAERTDILDAIANLTNGTTPVSLPVTPPSGYGGLDDVGTAAAVWGDTAVYSIPTKGGFTQFSGQAAYVETLTFGRQWAENPSMYIVWNPLGETLPTPGPGPNPLLTNAMSTDTLATWLAREASGYTWIDWPYNSDYMAAYDTTDHLTVWIPRWSKEEFSNLLAQMFGSGAIGGAPVWPGLAGVTLGTPVAIDTGVTITEPMDGVLIDITAVPGKQGSFSFDTQTSWRNIGALAFGTDDGEYEFPQTLGFVSAVYVPKSMTTSASVVLRSIAGVSGTITPWSRV